MAHLRHAAALALLLTTSAACGGGGGSGSADGTDAPAPASATLTRAADCDDLLTRLRADARAKITVQADDLRANGWTYAGAGGPTPVATPAPVATASPSSGPPAATDTNGQVPGIDEADVVETDGERIYLLQDTALVMLAASPPTALAVLDRVPLEGNPEGMFVANGRALVVSHVYDGTPSACLVGQPVPSPTASVLETPGIRPECRAGRTKLTLLDVTTTPARLVREVYVGGTFIAARRQGGRARVVTQYLWLTLPGVVDAWSVLWSSPPPTSRTEFVARVDAWKRSALAAVDATVLTDWLPALAERVDGRLAERALTCTNAVVPPAGRAGDGATLVVGIDIGSDAPGVDDALVLGRTDEVYANADTLVLAEPDWQPEPPGDAATRTALHVFALPTDASGIAYRGSGFVPGIPLSQFSLDVRDDVLRVATSFVHRDAPATTVTRVTTARVADGALDVLGSTEDLAPNETLQGVRFLGDRAYLVTFVYVDPLLVVDLSDPAHPHAVGEVQLPGFSEYLHPLDRDHLLTIGRAGTPGGRVGGLALRVFDLADASAPRVVDEYDLPPSVSSPAEYDHLAFTFDAVRGLLALPVTSYEDGPRAMLDVFGVSTTAGIDLRGTIDRGAPTLSPCPEPYVAFGCGELESMRRGLFIGDDVYSIATKSVAVHALDDLATPIASVVLP